MLHNYGITKMHLKDSMKYAALISAVGIAIITVLGLFVGFKNFSLDVRWLAFYLLVSVPLQEFVFRGFILTHLLKIEKLRRAGAIIIAAIIYSSIHYSNPIIVVLALVAGIAWNYAFYKKPNLLGPIISHAILGSYLFLLVL